MADGGVGDSGGGNVVVPMNEGGVKKPSNILDSISTIQQFHVLESQGRDIASDFLTIKGTINFFNIGVKTGLKEGLMFIFLSLFFIPILSDPTLMFKLEHFLHRGAAVVITFIIFLNISPVLLSAGLCSYLARFYGGSITKKAIGALLGGRMLLLIIKAVLIFFIFNMVASLLTARHVYTIAHFFSPHNDNLAFRIYVISMDTAAKLPEAAFIAVVVFFLAIMIPLVSIFGASTIKRLKNRKNMKKQKTAKTDFSKGKIDTTCVTIGRGNTLKKSDKMQDIILSHKDRTGHVFGFGSTRIGKTRLIESMIEQDIRQGNSVTFFDPKGDIDIFSKILQVAIETDRMEDVFVVNPIFSNFSNKIDPLSHYYMPEEVVSHVISGIKTKDEFFVNIAYEITLSIVMSLIEQDKNEQIKAGIAPEDTRPTRLSFDDIRQKIMITNLSDLSNVLGGIEGEAAKETKITLDQIVKSPQDYFAKVSSSLRTVLTSLSTGSAGAIIGKTHINKFIERLNDGKKVILIVQTGSLLTRKTASIISRVLLSMIQSFIGRLYASGKKLTTPLALYMDEASNLMYLGIEDMFSKAGGANVMIHAFTQSISDLEAEIGIPAARKILDNTNTKIFMRVNDPNTAKYVSDYSGSEKRFSSILSLGGGITVREVEEPLVVADNLTTLKSREFYMFTYSGKYKGVTLESTPAILNIAFPSVNETSNAEELAKRQKESNNIIVLKDLSKLWTNRKLVKRFTEFYKEKKKDIIKQLIHKQRKRHVRYGLAAVAVMLIFFLKAQDKVDLLQRILIHIESYAIPEAIAIFVITVIAVWLWDATALEPLRNMIAEIANFAGTTQHRNYFGKRRHTNKANAVVKKSMNLIVSVFLHSTKDEPSVDVPEESIDSVQSGDNKQTDTESVKQPAPETAPKTVKQTKAEDIKQAEETAKIENILYKLYPNGISIDRKYKTSVVIDIHNYLTPFLDELAVDTIYVKGLKDYVAQALHVLDDYHNDCSSVVTQDFNNNNINNGQSSYDILKETSLARHTCDVVKIISSVYGDEKDKEKKLSLNILFTLYMSAIGHDLGKIPKFREMTKYRKEEHPNTSWEIMDYILSKIAGDTGKFFIDKIKDAITYHHSGEQKDDEMRPFLVALKKADARAREQELIQYKKDHPESAKIVDQCIVNYKKMGGREEKEDESLHEIVIEWLNQDIIDQLLAVLKGLINKRIKGDGYVKAIYIGNGDETVYVMSTFLAELFLNVAENNGKKEFADKNKIATGKLDNISLTIKNRLAKSGYIIDIVDPGQFFNIYKFIGKNGGEITHGGYMPILLKAFKLTKNEKEELIKTKDVSTNRILHLTVKVVKTEAK